MIEYIATQASLSGRMGLFAPNQPKSLRLSTLDDSHAHSLSKAKPTDSLKKITCVKPQRYIATGTRSHEGVKN